jgi:hypothetical protein
MCICIIRRCICMMKRANPSEMRDEKEGLARGRSQSYVVTVPGHATVSSVCSLHRRPTRARPTPGKVCRFPTGRRSPSFHSPT